MLHGFSFANYLEELGPTAQQEICKRSTIDLALRDAFRKMRGFLMNTKGLTEDEAISLISVGVDFVLPRWSMATGVSRRHQKEPVRGHSYCLKAIEVIGGFYSRRLPCRPIPSTISGQRSPPRSQALRHPSIKLIPWQLRKFWERL